MCPDDGEYGACVRCGRPDTHGTFVELVGTPHAGNPDGGTGDPICPTCIALDEALKARDAAEVGQSEAEAMYAARDHWLDTPYLGVEFFEGWKAHAAYLAAVSPVGVEGEDEGLATGKMVEAACDSYLTSTGRVTEGAMERAINAALAASPSSPTGEDWKVAANWQRAAEEARAERDQLRVRANTHRKAAERERAARDAAEAKAERLERTAILAREALTERTNEREAAEAKAAAITEDRRKAVHWMEREREDARAERDRLAAALRESDDMLRGWIAQMQDHPAYRGMALSSDTILREHAALSVLDRER